MLRPTKHNVGDDHGDIWPNKLVDACSLIIIRLVYLIVLVGSVVVLVEL